MKKYLRKIKESRGAVSILAFITVASFVIVLLGAYISITVLRQSQIHSDIRIQEIYDKDVERIDSIYDNLVRIKEGDNDPNKKITIAGLKATGEYVTRRTEAYDDNDIIITIPAGYRVGPDSATVEEEGIVIEDRNIVSGEGNDRGNQWVWIPVRDVTQMYDEDSTGWTLTATDVITQFKSKNLASSVIGREITRGNPGTDAIREPGILSSTSHDNKSDLYTAAGYTSYLDMAKGLRDDYKDMLDSVRQFNGFYIGRFELGGTESNPMIKVGTVLSDINWYRLYAVCKSFTKPGIAETRMIWSNQWDEVCKFVRDNGDKVNLNDSREYGNYNNSTGDAAENSGGSNYINITGRSEAWKINNIYDLAGNASEWTQEANGTMFRTSRGGRYNVSGVDDSITSRAYKHSYLKAEYGYSTRPVLYIPADNIVEI